ncbi:hypothetical protein [Streptomyces luteolus]|uniref:Uncharacterized protein n=1 Tax=Streptomyces luteolus TaxID=3043615 RepID=A0ABT6SQT3_9ACTN|nr:hypothetical protein [Streptomyces sp. B-S-A12]MDI3417956.1 hypothetical protein [Streptomyces sp. B-S-A12]
MSTEPAKLTAAADRWEELAGKFKKLEDQYERDVYGVAKGAVWSGLSAEAAKLRFDTTLNEYRAAQKEAKALASLLRNAHTQLADLRNRVKTLREEAVQNGMRVTDQGNVSYDYDRLDKSARVAVAHDPSYAESIRNAVGEWDKAIKQAVKAVGEADAALARGLKTVVADRNLSDGTVMGFNSEAHGNFRRYQAEEKAHARERDKSEATTQTDGWDSKGKATATGPDAGASATGVEYGKQGMLKAYADLGHATAEGSLSSGDVKLSGIGDAYAGGRATASAGITEGGLSGTAEVSAGGRALAEARAESGHVGAYGRATGFAGAEAGVNAGVGPEGVKVGAEAIAGAKASVAGGVEAGGIGAGLTAEGWAGPGAEAGLKVAKEDDGKFHVGAKVGLSPVLGGAAGFEFTVDPEKVSDTAGALAGAVGDAAGAVRDGVTGLF